MTETTLKQRNQASARKAAQRQRQRKWLAKYGVTTAEALVSLLMAGKLIITKQENN